MEKARNRDAAALNIYQPPDVDGLRYGFLTVKFSKQSEPPGTTGIAVVGHIKFWWEWAIMFPLAIHYFNILYHIFQTLESKQYSILFCQSQNADHTYSVKVLRFPLVLPLNPCWHIKTWPKTFLRLSVSSRKLFSEHCADSQNISFHSSKLGRSLAFNLSLICDCPVFFSVKILWKPLASNLDEFKIFSITTFLL